MDRGQKREKDGGKKGERRGIKERGGKEEEKRQEERRERGKEEGPTINSIPKLLLPPGSQQ